MQPVVVVRAITPAQRLRDTTVRIFSNVIDDSVSLLQPSVELCSAFATACGVATVVERAEVLQALMIADKSVSLNFDIPAAVLWADHFAFPSEVWERDGMSLLRHNMSLESLLYEFHEQRRDSYLSPESVQRSLGTIPQPRFLIPRMDRDRLVEWATYGMIVSEPVFQPCPSPPVFRRRDCG